MRKIIFSSTALNDLRLFKSGNQKLVFRILEIINDMQSDPFNGIGKPEPLKGNLSGSWSRRINEEHRIIYKVTEQYIEISSCYGHY